MAKQISPGLLLLGGVVVGGLVIYGVTQAQEAKAKTKAKKKDQKKVPPAEEDEGVAEAGEGEEEADAGDGMPPAYRSPMPDVVVTLPATPELRNELDNVICKTFRSFDESPEPADLLFSTLEAWAPEGEWPVVAGDHPTMLALQAMTSFRIEQIARDTDPNRTPEENLDAFCPQVADVFEG